jgi:hypothetical protein
MEAPEPSHDERRRSERWHVGKEIPLALVLTLFFQTGGWIWWAATQSAKLDALTVLMSDFKQAQYTQNDSRRDLSALDARHNEVVRRVEVLEAIARRTHGRGG